MGKYFVRGTPLAGLERMMMEIPNFAVRSSGKAILCRYHLQAADLDCRNCLQYRHRGCRSLTCLYLTERMQAGAVTMEEMISELVRPWKHLRLKQRAMTIACQAKAFYFEGQLHIARMLRMTQGEETVNSRWLAAVYLLSSHASLWQKTLAAVSPGQIAFDCVRLDNTTVQDYVLYRVAKGLCFGTLGATSEELADPELVSDDTLLLILCAALIARYGPEVTNIGRAAR